MRYVHKTLVFVLLLKYLISYLILCKHDKTILPYVADLLHPSLLRISQVACLTMKEMVQSQSSLEKLLHHLTSKEMTQLHYSKKSNKCAVLIGQHGRVIYRQVKPSFQ